ncbi:MAG: GNAT family acetyltransferase [Bacteroidetes bacterium]|nr:MAG: GNAT family acetyltransferase [Bacteroidota bacterium]
MIIRGYGIELIRLRHEDIELVRLKRNSEHVRRHMEYREEISPEMQEKWFAGINTVRNNYFIIVHEGVKIGLISGADIHWEKKETRNGGIFIWEQEYWNTTIPLSASFLLTDISFILGLEKTFIRVLRDNTKAIAFNRQLGYRIVDEHDENYNQLYVLTQDHYEAKTAKLRETLLRKTDPQFICNIDDPDLPWNRNIINIYDNLSTAQKKNLVLTFKSSEV